MRPIIENAIEKEIETLYDHLISMGLPRKKIDRSFENYKSKSIIHSPCVIKKSARISNSKKKVFLIKDYHQNAHALFGDFRNTYSKFAERVLITKQAETKEECNDPGRIKTKKYTYCTTLVPGPGWIIYKDRDNNNYHEIKTELSNDKIPFEELGKGEHEKIVKKSRKNPPKEEDSDDENVFLSEEDLGEFITNCKCNKTVILCRALLNHSESRIKPSQLKDDIGLDGWKNVVNVGVKKLKKAGYIRVENGDIIKLWV